MFMLTLYYTSVEWPICGWFEAFLALFGEHVHIHELISDVTVGSDATSWLVCAQKLIELSILFVTVSF